MNLPTDLETAHTMIRQLLQQADELQALARIDAVTHIANRRAFDERLNAAFAHARRTSTSLSVAVLDLDDFKTRNDTFGHAAGDACLKAFAAQLVSHSRADDFVARIGGEEFAIIFPNTCELAAALTCERIASTVRYGCCAGAPLTFSAGVAELDGSAMHPSTVVEHADRAMYLAKRSGKNRISIHRPTFHRAVVDGGLFQRLTRYRSL